MEFPAMGVASLSISIIVVFVTTICMVTYHTGLPIYNQDYVPTCMVQSNPIHRWHCM